MSSSAIWRKVLFVVAVLSIALALIFIGGINTMLSTLKGTTLFFVVLAIAVYFLGVGLWASRWRIILTTCGCTAGLRRLMLVIMGATFVNNITPFTYSGGDPVAKAYILRKTAGVTYTACAVTLANEFVIDFVIYFSLLCWGLFLSGFAPYIIALWGGVLAILLGVITNLLRRNRRGAISFLSKLGCTLCSVLRRKVSQRKVRARIHGFIRLLGKVPRDAGAFAKIICFSVAIWATIMSRYILIFFGLGYVPAVAMIMLAVTMTNLAGMIPLLPGGLVTVDITNIAVFTTFGVPAHVSIAAVLIERFISYVIGTIAGAVALSYLGVSRREVRQKRTVVAKAI